MEERKRKRAEEKAEENVKAKSAKLDHLTYMELWEEAKRKRMILKKHCGGDCELYFRLRNVIHFKMHDKYWRTVANLGMRPGMFGYPTGNRYMMECSLEAVTEVAEELNA